MVHRMMIHLTVLQAGRLLLAEGSVAPRPLLAKQKLIAEITAFVPVIVCFVTR